MSDLIMFDFDGVIADSLDVMHDATVKALRDHGLGHLVSDDLVPRLVESNWFEGLRKMGVPAPVVREMDDLYAVAAAAGQVEPYDGVREVIADLAERHIIVIVTSNRSDIVADLLAQWDFSGVGEVLGGDKGKSKVPKLRGAVSRYPLVKAFFIGDSVGDIVEGRSAGVHTVAVTWGWHSEDRLLGSSPDYVVRAPRDLLRLLLESHAPGR